MATMPPQPAIDVDAHLQRCGFAKIVGSVNSRPVEHYVAKYEVVLGRNSKSSTVDIELGATLACAARGSQVWNIPAMS